MNELGLALRECVRHSGVNAGGALAMQVATANARICKGNPEFVYSLKIRCRQPFHSSSQQGVHYA